MRILAAASSATHVIGFLCALVALTLSSSRASAELSPHRLQGESEDQAYARAHGGRIWKKSSTSVYAGRGKLDEKARSRVQEWTEFQPLQGIFQLIRDDRFLVDQEHKGVLRRLSWLYPDDGCYARAELARVRIQRLGFQKPSKIFAFGKLEAPTLNHPQGVVRWWYHVVVGYRLGQDVWVFDPSIKAEHPMRIEEWAQRMGQPVENLSFSICDSTSYEPDSPCQSGPGPELGSVVDMAQTFLNREWSRMIELGRDPQDVLVGGSQSRDTQ